MQNTTSKAKSVTSQRDLRSDFQLIIRFGTKFASGPALYKGAAARREVERLRREVANAARVLKETRRLDRLARQNQVDQVKS